MAVIRNIDREKLRNLVVKATDGCEIQHDGWPCNTCFHYMAGSYNFPRDIHYYWLAVLAFRGDYDDYDIKRRDDLLEELMKVLEQ